jgi:hypothetical protein
MIIEMLANVMLWINAFPPSSGVSKTFSPRTIMTGTALDFNKHCQIPFGAYAEVHEDRNITNTMEERTQSAICLGPTANFQGSYKFLSLRTGKRITRKQFKELPMPDYIIKRVEAMSEREKQDKTITFSNRSGTDEADAGVYAGDNGPYDGPTNKAPGIAIEQPKAGTTPGVTAEDGVTPGVTPHESTGVITNEHAMEHDAEIQDGTTGVAPKEVTTATSIDEGVAGTDGNKDENPPPLGPPRSEDDSDDDDDDTDVDDGIETSHDEIPEDEVYQLKSMTPSIQRIHGLWPRKPRDNSHMHSHATVMHHAMTQYSLKKGLRNFQKFPESGRSGCFKGIKTSAYEGNVHTPTQ